MRRWFMRSRALFLLLLLPVSIYAQSEIPAPRPGTRIITAEEIRQAGLLRLGDVFDLLNDWFVASTEGYNLEVSANGLAPLQSSSWLLLLDGQPVDLGLLDAPNLNVLPATLSQIAYIEIISHPTFVAGVYAPAGVLHLHTHTPEPGVSIRGSMAAGNQIGDPGPYRYTPLASPNIDRIGPVYGAAGTASTPSTHARLIFKNDEHHATDEQLRERVLLLYQGIKKPRLLMTGVGLDVGTRTRYAHHTLFGGFSRYQDLRFFELLGLEVPAEQRFYQAGVRGRYTPTSRLSMTYRASYAVSDLDPRESRTGIEFNFRQNRFRGNYELRLYDKEVWSAFGLTADFITSYTGKPLDKPDLFTTTGYMKAGLEGRYFEPSLTLFASRVQAEAGYGALATVLVHPDTRQTFSLNASIAQMPYSSQNNLWQWVDEGYRFPQFNETNLMLPAQFDQTIQHTADVSWHLHVSDRFGLTLSGAFRQFEKQTLARYSFDLDSTLTRFVTQTRVQGSLRGRVLKGAAELRFRPVPSLEQRFYYSYLRYPTEDEAFFQAWRNQPWHRFSYTARFTPNPRLSLYARFGYHSETQWPSYRAAAESSQLRYPAALSAYWLLDVAVQKRLWHDHLRTSLGLRNLLHEDYRQHPAGGIADMTFIVRLEAYFGTRAN